MLTSDEDYLAQMDYFKKTNIRILYYAFFKRRIWWSQRWCVTAVPQDCHPQTSIFMANQAQAAWQQRQRLLFRFKTQLLIWKARLPSLLPCHFPWQNFCYMFCCQSESSRICSLGKYLLSSEPHVQSYDNGKKIYNRDGRVPATKTFSLIHCSFLSASIATWFQTQEHQNEIHNFKKFLLFQWIISNFLVYPFLNEKAQQSHWLLKDTHICIVFETVTWTKRQTDKWPEPSKWFWMEREITENLHCSEAVSGTPQDTKKPTTQIIIVWWILTVDGPKVQHLLAKYLPVFFFPGWLRGPLDLQRCLSCLSFWRS